MDAPVLNRNGRAERAAVEKWDWMSITTLFCSETALNSHVRLLNECLELLCAELKAESKNFIALAQELLVGEGRSRKRLPCPMYHNCEYVMRMVPGFCAELDCS
jgi:hypothetical protein